MTRPGWPLWLYAAAAVASCAAEALAKCHETLALPGAAVWENMDVIVLAPGPHGSLRWCYWNSPMSGGGPGSIEVAGEVVGFVVTVTSGPEILKFTLPGAVATDMNGVPLMAIEVPDDDERSGLLFRGMM